MKGWLDNYNDSKISVPPNFVGMGNSTQGRKYSPAWGGQFDEGGKVSGNYIENTVPNLTKRYSIPINYTEEDSIAFTPILKRLNDYVGYKGGADNLNPLEEKHVRKLVDILINPYHATSDSTFDSHVTKDIVNDKKFKTISDKLSTMSDTDINNIFNTDFSKLKGQSLPNKIVNLLKLKPSNVSIPDIYKSVKYIDEGPLWPMGEIAKEQADKLGYLKNGGEIAQDGVKKKKKVIVFAESPMNTRSRYSAGENESQMPEHLRKLSSDIMSSQKQLEDLYGKAEAADRYAKHYLKGYYGDNNPYDYHRYDYATNFHAGYTGTPGGQMLPQEEYMNDPRSSYQSLHDAIRNPRTSLSDARSIISISEPGFNIPDRILQDLKQDAKVDSLNKIQSRYTNAFYNDPQNVIELGRSDVFSTEADNVRKFYANDPNVEVDAVPFYGDKKLMRDKLSTLSPEDIVAIFGHSGDKLGGIDNKEWSEELSKCSAKDIYIGSCGFEHHIKDFNLPDKNVSYRPDTPWLGFNPNAKTFLEGMYSRARSTGGMIEDEIVNPKKGINYDTIPAKMWIGGNISKAKNGVELTKLDQLTNFTNYNKPTRGGWLSKYE